MKDEKGSTEPLPWQKGQESDKTYTCDKCGKVGNDFVEMADEECPADPPNHHQIPIFGDM